MIHTAKHIAKTILDPYFWIRSRREVTSLLDSGQLASPYQVLDFVSRYAGAGPYRKLAPLQVKKEYLDLLTWAWKQGFCRIAEIGTAQGGTLVGWLAMKPERLISIDLPGGIHGGGYPARKAALFRLLQQRISPQTRLDLVREDSHSEATFQRVNRLLDGKQLDFLLIDGDHRYAGVRRDWELWTPLVRKGGFVAFHDVVPHKKVGNTCEVDRLWEELRNKYPDCIEIIADREQGWAGIGIVPIH